MSAVPSNSTTQPANYTISELYSKMEECQSRIDFYKYRINKTKKREAKNQYLAKIALLNPQMQSYQMELIRRQQQAGRSVLQQSQPQNSTKNLKTHSILSAVASASSPDREKIEKAVDKFINLTQTHTHNVPLRTDTLILPANWNDTTTPDLIGQDADRLTQTNTIPVSPQEQAMPSAPAPSTLGQSVNASIGVIVSKGPGSDPKKNEYSPRDFITWKTALVATSVIGGIIAYRNWDTIADFVCKNFKLVAGSFVSLILPSRLAQPTLTQSQNPFVNLPATPTTPAPAIPSTPAPAAPTPRNHGHGHHGHRHEHHVIVDLLAGPLTHWLINKKS